MRMLIFSLLNLLAIYSFAQDEFIGTYVRELDENSFETIIISDTEECYAGQFGEGGLYDINIRDILVECYLDEEYFFLVISWDEFEFEISPLEWDEIGAIYSFELIAEFELPEPLIFYRQYE